MGAHKFEIHLRRTDTGETRAVPFECAYAPDEPHGFDQCLSLWEDGNYACDCNRSLFLYDGDESKALDCGELIVIDDAVELESGKSVYREAA